MEKLLRREVELHLKERIIEWKHLNNSGSTNASFFATTVSGKSYTVKYNYLCKTTLQQRIIRTIIDGETKHVFPKLRCSYISLSFPFRVCFITEWLEGKPLDISNLNSNLNELYNCVSEVSQKLKTVHSAKITVGLKARSLKNDYKKALRTIKQHHIDIPHLAEFIACIDANINDCNLPAVAVVHFDFHPGNIIKTEDGYRVVDLETICIAETWRDLAYATEIHVPEQHRFWFLFLLAYFDGGIPEEFYKTSKIYVLVYMLMLAKQNRNTGWNIYLNLVNTVYSDYNALHSNKPNWMIKTAMELYENAELSKESFRSIIESDVNGE